MAQTTVEYRQAEPGLRRVATRRGTQIELDLEDDGEIPDEDEQRELFIAYHQMSDALAIAKAAAKEAQVRHDIALEEIKTLCRKLARQRAQEG